MSSLRYAVRVDAPARHTAEVELRFAPTADTVDLTMPAWCPGSYLIRDYARFVRDLDGRRRRRPAAQATKLDKPTWRIETAGARELTVRYALYGHDLTVRTNHIDADARVPPRPGDVHLSRPAMRAAPVEVDAQPPRRLDARPPRWPGSAPPGTGADAPRTSTSSTITRSTSASTRTYTVPATVPVRARDLGRARARRHVRRARGSSTDLGAIVDDHVARFGEAPFPTTRSC